MFLARLFVWFVTFGLSLALERIGISEQGIGFIFVDVVFSSTAILCAGAMLLTQMEVKRMDIVFYHFVLPMICMYSLRYVVALMMTKIFEIDFYIVFQVMSFGWGYYPKFKITKYQLESLKRG